MFRLRIHKPQVINTILAILLLFFSFSIVSFNVFTVPIEQYAPSLTSVWPRALGSTSLLDSVITLLTVVHLNLSKSSSSTSECADNPLTYRTRIVAIPIAAFYLLLSLSKLALALSSQWLVYLSVATLGIPYAYFYLVAVEVLTSWMPKYPVLSMTFVSLSYGLSQFFISPILYQMISILGVVNALVATSVSLFVLCSACGLLLSFPTVADRQAIAHDMSVRHSRDEEQQLITETESVMPWYEIIKKRKLYKFIMIVFLGRASFGLYIFYFKLGYVFEIAMDRMVIAFQLLAVGSMIWTFFMNAMHEIMTQRLGKSITKPSIMISFLAQAVFFLLLIQLSTAVEKHGSLALWVISVAIALDEQQMAYSVVLAQDMFGEKNGTTAFGIAVALAMSPGEALFPYLMALIETRLGVEGVSSPNSYVLYYVIGSVCLFFGALLVAF